MAKRKNSNPSTVVIDESKKVMGEWEEYWNTKAYAMAPSNGDHKKRLAITLMEWGTKQKGARDIEDFCDEVGVVPQTYYEWLHKCPELKEAHEFAKRRLASLKLKNSQEGKWNWQACKWALMMYGDRFVENEERIASITKKEEGVVAGKQVVVMEVYPATSVVPVKTTKEANESRNPDPS